MCLIFVMVVLQQVEGVTGRQHIIKRINRRLKDWEAGKFKMLVETSYREGLMFLGRGQREMLEAKVHLQYNNLLIAEKIREAVRFLTERDQGGILLPTDACTKTGKPVEEVLRDKHPPSPLLSQQHSQRTSQCLSLLLWTSQRAPCRRWRAHCLGGRASWRRTCRS